MTLIVGSGFVLARKHLDFLPVLELRMQRDAASSHLFLPSFVHVPCLQVSPASHFCLCFLFCLDPHYHVKTRQTVLDQSMQRVKVIDERLGFGKEVAAQDNVEFVVSGGVSIDGTPSGKETPLLLQTA